MTDETIIAEDDSIINDTDLNEDLESEQVAAEPVTQPKSEWQSNIAKILAQRNEARKEKNALKKQLENLSWIEERFKAMEEMIAKQTLESEAKQKQNEFYNANPEAKQFESWIEEIRSKYPDMDLNDAYDLYLAKNSPDKLASEGLKNKQDANKLWLTWVTPDPLTEKDPNDWRNMTDDEFFEWRRKQLES